MALAFCCDHIFYGNVNKGSYSDILDNFVLPQLEDFLNTQFENSMFQHLWLMRDGAPGHRLLALRLRLPEIFDNFVVAEKHEIQ